LVYSFNRGRIGLTPTISTVTESLQRYPVLFDCLQRLNRKWRRQSPSYKALANYLPDEQKFTFLQIGANDGITTDPYREFMIRQTFRGIAVEPVPSTFIKLQYNYQPYANVLPLNCAVGYPPGKLPFYTWSTSFLEGKGQWGKELTGLAGFSREKLVDFLSSESSPDDCIEELIVPVRTVEELMDAHDFDQFDALFLDCEGHEQNILTNMDMQKVNPRLIVFEHTHFGERATEIEDHLAKHGFAFTHLQYDTLAYRLPT
jgi:FkbM family methyltransferase